MSMLQNACRCAPARPVSDALKLRGVCIKTKKNNRMWPSFPFFPVLWV